MPQFRSTNVYVVDRIQVPDPKTGQQVTARSSDTDWGKKVTAVLESIYQAGYVGRRVFDAFQKAGYNSWSGKMERGLVIVPYTKADEQTPTKNGTMGVCNAYDAADDAVEATAPEHVDGETFWFVGGGSSATVHYEPERWAPGGRCNGGAGSPGGQADEVLLHEMLHALRDVAGQSDMAEIGGNYDTIEEFYSILITNVYMSEKGQTAFRHNHHGYGPLPKELATSEGFLTNFGHLRWLKWLVNHNAVFLQQVASVPAAFNPVQLYLADPKKYNARIGG